MLTATGLDQNLGIAQFTQQPAHRFRRNTEDATEIGQAQSMDPIAVADTQLQQQAGKRVGRESCEILEKAA